MAVQQLVVTLTGSAQQLSTLLPASTQGKPFFVWISIQADPGNTHVAYVGDANLTSSLYGFRIEVPVTNIPPAPNILEDLTAQAHVTLDQIYVLGTNAEKLHLLLISWS